MKLATFETLPEDPIGPRVGLVLPDGSVADLNLALTILEAGRRDPGAMVLRSKWARDGILGFLRAGQDSIDAAKRVLDFVSERIGKGAELKGAKGTPVVHPAGGVRFRAPIPRPGKVIAMGFNFEDHVLENPNAPRPRFPMGFLQAASSIVGHEDPVVYPSATKELDYEVEVAVVIGKGGKRIPPERAFEHVAGYTIFNDLSARDIQRGEMKLGLLVMGKNLDGLAPLGPYLVLADEVPDPHDLTLECWVNDEPEPRQRGNTAHMIFKIPDLIAHWSNMTLEPGDIITTGTPSGVATFRTPREDYYLKPGDTVRCVVSRLGELRNRIVAETE
ncbi:MAG: fumarylacetoacetate hydrolase family protein [Candidatus Tectomicrobia bacterium]|nr:fumarylacetoacetate hydrolase family protein [Candidatus Tectomicrobia bacterium]